MKTPEIIEKEVGHLSEKIHMLKETVTQHEKRLLKLEELTSMKSLAIKVVDTLRKRLTGIKGLGSVYYSRLRNDEVYLLCDIPDGLHKTGQVVCDIVREVESTHPDIFIDLGIVDLSRGKDKGEWFIRGLEKLIQ